MQVQGIIVDVFPLMQFIAKWRNECDPRIERYYIRDIITSMNTRIKANKMALQKMYASQTFEKELFSKRDKSTQIDLLIKRDVRKQNIKHTEDQLEVLKLRVKQLNRLLLVFDEVNKAEFYKGKDISEFQTINWCYNLCKQLNSQTIR